MAQAAEAGDAGGPRLGAQAVERSLAILECFRGEVGDLGISEIARSVGISVSTAHRIARALCQHQFLEQDGRTDRYRLGRTLAALGQRASEHLGFELASPAVERLARDTGESASLSVLQGRDVLIVLCAPSEQRLQFHHAAGSLVHAHASAMGKAMLAFAGGDVKATVAALGPFERYTPNTLTSRAKLVADLEEVRRRGFAVNREERYVGVVGVAAAIVDAHGLPRASIGIQGPSARLTEGQVAEVAEQVVVVADVLSKEMRLDRI
jgi:DNA-binding IclR family transcriptional regulator